jgi:hypothetical protein
MRVIVDEGIGDTSPLWQQFQAWLGDRSAEIVWLATRYPAIPDVELLDKLLTPDTVLLTRDGVLHNRALAQGMRSFTLNAQGQLTRKPRPLESRRGRAPAPSVLPQLKASYQHEPHPIALALSANRPPKVLKAQRTRRRRIRSYFGSVDNIARVAWTIGARPHQGHLLCGYVMHVEGYRGVKGLRASEGYGIDRHLAPDAAQALVFALCEVFQLHLESVRHEFFIIPHAAYDLARKLAESPLASPSPLHDTLHQLLQAIPHQQLSPCVKGRFYEQMQSKLDQLATSVTNEIVAVDFGDVMRRLAGEDRYEGR